MPSNFKSSGHRTKARVKTAKARRASSTRWLHRQLNDPYVWHASQQGYRARSAFKLLEIQEKFSLIQPQTHVIDLGCTPGSWSQIAARLSNANQAQQTVVALDVLPMEPILGVKFIQMDISEPCALERISSALAATPALVLSDMAAATTGHAKTDHLRTIALAELAADTAVRLLAPGGAFVTKLFQGGVAGEILLSLRYRFKTVRYFKPKASRKESAEIYLIAQGFKG